jgi:hypothetical protein
LRIGRTVREPSIFHWEANNGTPEIRFMRAIIRFLGYNPLPEAKSLAEQLVRQRTTLELSRENARCHKSQCQRHARPEVFHVRTPSV